MKVIRSIVVLLLPYTFVFAQSKIYVNGGATSGIQTTTGNYVGIGATSFTPSEQFHINGNFGGEINLLIQNTYSGGLGTRTFLTSTPSRSLLQTDKDFGLWTTYGGWSEKFTVLNGGNVGIGINTPTYKLDVLGNARVDTYMDVGGQRNTNSATGGLNVYDPDGQSYTNIQLAQRAWGGSHAILFNAYKTNAPVNGDLSVTGNTKYSNPAGAFSNGAAMIHFGGNSGYLDFYISPASTGQNNSVDWQTPLMSLRRNGNVGIGTTNPNQKLTVNGTIYGKEVKVDLSVPGPDYVFEKDYQLPSLESVQNYIDQNKHLPEVPSAKEMEANGVNLSEMNMLLLKKIEELTLYQIESARQLKLMRQQIEELEKKNRSK